MLNINTANTKPNYTESYRMDGFEVLPENFYNVTIVDVDDKPTKANDGNYLEFKFEVIDGDYKGRYLWSRINYNNKNPKVSHKAEQQIINIAHATGVHVVNVNTLPQFLGKMLSLHVYIVPEKDGYKAKNEIDQYLPSGIQAQPATTQTAGSTKPAWAK